MKYLGIIGGQIKRKGTTPSYKVLAYCCILVVYFFLPNNNTTLGYTRLDILQIVRCFEMVQGGLKFVKVYPDDPNFQAKVISLSKQGNQVRYSPDWEMFLKGLRWIKICQSLPR